MRVRFANGGQTRLDIGQPLLRFLKIKRGWVQPDHITGAGDGGIIPLGQFVEAPRFAGNVPRREDVRLLRMRHEPCQVGRVAQGIERRKVGRICPGNGDAGLIERRRKLMTSHGAGKRIGDRLLDAAERLVHLPPLPRLIRIGRAPRLAHHFRRIVDAEKTGAIEAGKTGFDRITLLAGIALVEPINAPCSLTATISPLLKRGAKLPVSWAKAAMRWLASASGRNLGQADAAGRQRILELACRPASLPGFVDIAGCLAKLPCIIRLRCLRSSAAARGGLVLGLRGAFRALTAFLGAACGFFSLDRRLDYAIVSSTACSITIEDRRWWFRNAGSGIREFALCLRVPPHFAQDLVSTARSQLILFRLPLIFECPLGAPLCLQRLRLLSARQLRAVEVCKSGPRFLQGVAAEFFVECVMSPGLVYYEIAIAAIAVRQDEAPLLDCRFERPAIIGVLIAIKDRVADRANIGAKPARFLHLVGVGGSGSVMWLAVVVQLPQPEFSLQAAAGFLEPQLEEAGIDGAFLLNVNTEPGGVHVPFAGCFIHMKAPDARQVTKAKPLLLAQPHNFPLLGRQPLVSWQPRLRMKPWFLASGGRIGHALHEARCLTWVAAEKVKASGAAEFHTLVVPLGAEDVIDQLHATGVQITLREHREPPRSPRQVPRILRADDPPRRSTRSHLPGCPDAAR